MRAGEIDDVGTLGADVGALCATVFVEEIEELTQWPASASRRETHQPAGLVAS